MHKSRLHRILPLIMIWSGSYERLAWTPLLVLIALKIESPEALAFAASADSAANLVGNVLFGSLSDRFGRYKIAGIALLGLAITTLLHLEAWTVLFFVGVRLSHGFFAAAITPTTLAAASEGIAPARRGQTMAQIGLMIALASIIGPPLSGRLADALSLDTTLYIHTAFLATVGFLGLASHRRLALDPAKTAHDEGPAQRSRAGQEAADGEQRDGRSRFRLSHAVDVRVTIFACILGFAVFFGQNILFYALPLQSAAMGLRSTAIGGMFGMFAVGAAIAFMPPFSKVADRYGRIRPIVLGCAAAAFGLFFLGRGLDSTQFPMVYTSLFVYGFGFGLAFPAISATMADSAADARRGLAFGLLTAAFSVGAIVSPLIAQSLDHLVSPFTVGAIMMAAGLSATVITRRVPHLRQIPGA